MASTDAVTPVAAMVTCYSTDLAFDIEFWRPARISVEGPRGFVPCGTLIGTLFKPGWRRVAGTAEPDGALVPSVVVQASTRSAVRRHR